MSICAPGALESKAEEMEMENREKRVFRSLRIWEEMEKEFQDKAKSSWSYALLASLSLCLPYSRMRNSSL